MYLKRGCTRNSPIPIRPTISQPFGFQAEMHFSYGTEEYVFTPLQDIIHTTPHTRFSVSEVPSGTRPSRGGEGGRTWSTAYVRPPDRCVVSSSGPGGLGERLPRRRDRGARGSALAA